MQTSHRLSAPSQKVELLRYFSSHQLKENDSVLVTRVGQHQLELPEGGAFPAPGGSAAGDELTMWGWKRGPLAAYSYVAQDK